MAGLFIGFSLRNAPLVKVIANPILDGIVFKNELTHFTLLDSVMRRRVERSHEILALLDGFQELHLDW